LEPWLTDGLELPLGVLEDPGLGLLPVVVVPGRLGVVVVPPPLLPPLPPLPPLLPPLPPDPPDGGVVVVPPGVVVVPPGVVVVPPGRGRGGRVIPGTVAVVTPGTPIVTLLLRALALDFLVRLLQTAFLDFFFFFCFATTACESPLAELEAPEAANADAKPAVGVTSRASKQATARLYALGDIERAPFLRWGTGAPGWASHHPLAWPGG
jgi:hypothetical protein